MERLTSGEALEQAAGVREKWGATPIEERVRLLRARGGADQGAARQARVADHD
jgi:hypothetical protein